MDPTFTSPLQDSDHPILKAAFAYWKSKAPPGRLPGRQHIDPIEMRGFLPNLTLIDVERAPDGPRFRFRLIGTIMTMATDRDATGTYIDPARAPGVIQRLTEIVETRQPYSAVERINTPQRHHLLARRLVLPLAGDGVNIDMILSCIVIEPVALPEALLQPHAER